MRTSLLGLALLASTAFAAPAAATEIGGGFNVSGNAALVTDYRFRGVSFSDEDIPIQGGIDLEHDSGFYVGTWGSSIEDSPVFGHTEVDIYAGCDSISKTHKVDMAGWKPIVEKYIDEFEKYPAVLANHYMRIATWSRRRSCIAWKVTARSRSGYR